jgi:hypothetical protein
MVLNLCNGGLKAVLDLRPKHVVIREKEKYTYLNYNDLSS